MAIVLKTISDSSEARRDLAKLEASVNNINKSVVSVKDSFSDAAKSIAAAASAFVVGGSLIKQIDFFTSLENKIKVATSTNEEFLSSLYNVKKLAMGSRSDLTAIATSYQRIAMAGEEIGVSQSQALKVTDLLAKSLKISGASAGEAASSLTQFGQAIASGKLSGDEFKSLSENAPFLVKAIRESLNVTQGALREMSEKGKLTSEVVLRAILKRADEIETKFGKLKPTFEEAFGTLGLSFKLLLDSALKYFWSSSGDIATFINNLARKIGDFALNFDFYMLKSKTTILRITYTILDSFKFLNQEIGKIFNLEILDSVDSFVSQISAAASNFSPTNMFKSLYAGFQTFINDVRVWFSNISLDIKPININEIFPSLGKALDIVKKWAINVEHWFFWVYDRVIGHSWIPDLVNGVIEWISKIKDKPIAYIKSFASIAELSFKKLFEAMNNNKLNISVTSGMLLFLFKFRTEILNIIKLLPRLSGIAAILTGAFSVLTIASDKNAIAQFAEIFDNSALSYIQKITKAVLKLRDIISFKVQDTNIVRMFKQMMGIKDKIPGKLWGQEVDTSTNVGLGPRRNREKRPFLSDFLYAFPKGWQLPITVAIAGAIGLGVVKGFDEGIIRTVLLSALTTAWGIFTTKAVKKEDFREFTTNIITMLLNGIREGLALIWKNSVFKDPLGSMVLLAKSALIFQAAREAFVRAAGTFARAPTTAILDIGRIFERSQLRKSLGDLDAQIANMPARLQNINNAQRVIYQRQIGLLASMTDSTGRLIGMLRAERAVRDRDFNRFGTVATNQAVRAATDARANYVPPTQFTRYQTQQIAPLEQRRDATTAQIGRITEHLNQVSQNFQQGFKNMASGGLGFFAGFGGMQIGLEIAKGMEGYSGWAKLGLVIFSSAVMQAIGAGIGLVFSEILLAVAGSIGALIFAKVFMSNWWVLGAVVITAAFVTAFELFKKLPESWRAALGEKYPKIAHAANVSERAYDKLWGPRIWAIASVFDYLIESIKKIPDLLFKDIPNLFKAMNEQFVKPFIAWIDNDLKPKWTKSLEDSGNWVKDKLKPYSDAIDIFVTDFNRLSALIREMVDKYNNASMAKPQPLQNFATGGSIYGPGTSKSDSIPAMLSNGEFVVNARSANKYRRLLEAINAGEVVGFDEGGRAPYKDNLSAIERYSSLYSVPTSGLQTQLTTAIKEINKKDVNVKEIVKPVSVVANKPLDIDEKTIVDTFTNKLEWLGKIFGDVGNKLMGGFSPGFSSMPADESVAELSKELAKYGKNFTAVQLQEAGPVAQSNIRQALKEIRKLEEEIKETGREDSRKNLIKDWSDYITKTFNENYIKTTAGKPGSFANIGDSDKKDKTKELKLQDQLSIIQEIFPQIEFTLEDFYKVSNEFREKLFGLANGVKVASDALNTKPLSELKNVDVKAERDRIEKQRNESLNKALELATQVKAPYTLFKNSIDKLGINISEEAYNVLSKEDLLNVKQLRDGIKAALDVVRAPVTDTNVTEAARRLAQIKIATSMSDIDNITQKALLDAGNKYNKLSKSLSDYGLNIDINTFARISNFERKLIEDSLEKLKSLDKDLTNDNESIRKAAVVTKEALLKSIGIVIEKASVSIENYSEIAGNNFYDSVTSGFKSGLKDLISGNANLKEFAIKAMETLSGSIADNFVEGLAKGFGKEDNMFSTAIKDFGSFLFGSGFNLTSSKKMDKSGVTTINAAKVFLNASSIIGPENLGMGVNPNDINTLPLNTSGWMSQPNLGGFADDYFGNMSFLPQSDLAGVAAQSSPTMEPVGAINRMFGSMESQTAKLAKSFEVNMSSAVSEDSSIFSTLSKTFSGLGESIMGGLQGAGDWLSSIDFGGMFAGLGFARGGVVNGPGTGTSDSIAAMLSDGEFVVNAKSTKKYKNLLSAINSGNMPKFADGGMVSMPLLQTPSMSTNKAIEKRAATASSSQTINLQITGDISRQTKAEIYKMMPQIAAGVNSQNKEMNYRR